VIALILGAALGYSGILGNAAKRTEYETTTKLISVSTSVSTSFLTTRTPSTVTFFASSSTTTTLPLYQGPGQLTWSKTDSYPLNGSDFSCVASSGDIFCVGGYNGTTPTTGQGDSNRTYFAPISSSGVGVWSRGTDYPIGIQDETCVSSSSYIYCVGGYVGSPNGHITQDVYYAHLSPSGIGAWNETTPFPQPEFDSRCVTDSGFIYCLTLHYNGTGYVNPPEVYYAQLSAGGVSDWALTNSPPSMTAGCSTGGGYMYCFGGAPCPPLGPDCPSPSYFALLSSNGAGTWSNTTDLPTAGYAAYAEADSYFYYFAGPGYFTGTSPGGFGQWQTPAPYPGNGPDTCVGYATYIYCIGVYDGDVYFATITQ